MPSLAAVTTDVAAVTVAIVVAAIAREVPTHSAPVARAGATALVAVALGAGPEDTIGMLPSSAGEGIVPNGGVGPAPCRIRN